MFASNFRLGLAGTIGLVCAVAASGSGGWARPAANGSGQTPQSAHGAPPKLSAQPAGRNDDAPKPAPSADAAKGTAPKQGLACPAPSSDARGEVKLMYLVIDDREIMGPCRLSRSDISLLKKAAAARHGSDKVAIFETYANFNCIFLTEDPKSGAIRARVATDMSAARATEAEVARVVGKRVVRGTQCK